MKKTDLIITRNILFEKRILFATFCFIWLFFSSFPSHAQQSEPEIYVDSSISDSDTTIGPQLIYLIKQDIQNSGRYLLSTDPNRNEYYIEIVTIEDSSDSDNEVSDAYSTVLTFHFSNKNLMDWYFTNRVGTCGQDVIASCAQTIVASFVNLIDSFRSSTNNNGQ